MTVDLPGWVTDEHSRDVEHRSGVPWSEAPAPARHGHEHYGWSRMWQGFDGLERCPCGAARYLSRPQWAWFYASDRDEQEARWADETGGAMAAMWRRLVSRA